MKKALLDKLHCPITGEPLQAIRSALDVQGGVKSAELCCACGRVYPLHDGIPTFVQSVCPASQTIRSFREKWAKHKYYREHTRRFYTDWYLQRYGFGDADGLRRFLADKKWILDAGTGAGRDAANLAEHSNAQVFAVDTAREPLEAAARELKHPRIAFIHADLHELPFADGFFDLINCDQVIHHTPDPRTAFDALSRKLAPGGAICCYVYKKKAVLREHSDDFIRSKIAGMPIDDALAACEGITKLGRSLAQLKVTVDIEEDIPVLGIHRGKMDLQRFFHWNVLKCFWNDEFDFFTNNIINFDWFHPEHCHRFEPDEFRAWFDGWEIQAWDVQEAGISCRARKR